METWFLMGPGVEYYITIIYMYILVYVYQDSSSLEDF